MGGETEDGGDAAPARNGSSSKIEAKTEPLVAKPKLDEGLHLHEAHRREALEGPGTINGQQFVIDRCEDCEIYILDECDSLMIDDCVRCKIVVGPTTGSIFMRDCSYCTCVFMCRPVPLQGLQGHRHSFARHHPADHRNQTNICASGAGTSYLGSRLRCAARASRRQNFEPYIQLQPRRRDVVTHAARTHRTRRARTLPDFSELEGVADALADGASRPQRG